MIIVVAAIVGIILLICCCCWLENDDRHQRQLDDLDTGIRRPDRSVSNGNAAWTTTTREHNISSSSQRPSTSATAFQSTTYQRPSQQPTRRTSKTYDFVQSPVKGAVLTISEMRKLHRIALNNTHQYTTCKVLYRNKPQSYFSHIFRHENGIMKTILKDNSGDPRSPINGRLSGLFFMAEVEYWSSTGEPCYASAFGDTRLIVPVRVMFNIAPNLYFTDFYCMKGQYHYVTLVMTKPGSAADQFCKQYLFSLSTDDKSNNPFLFLGDDGDMKVARGVKVEVFITENINVTYLMSYKGATIEDNIPLIGKGHTTLGGVPKNPDCRVCNLHLSDEYRGFNW